MVLDSSSVDSSRLQVQPNPPVDFQCEIYWQNVRKFKKLYSTTWTVKHVHEAKVLPQD